MEFAPTRLRVPPRLQLKATIASGGAVRNYVKCRANRTPQEQSFSGAGRESSEFFL
jgi:hypothetical protein